jgi:hypothetical protein
VQFYLSDAEHAALRAIARKRAKTLAGLFRFWIKRATPKRKPRQPPRDPRQLEIAS